MNYKFKPSHLIPAYLFVVAVLYGGSKPPSSTNEPPSGIDGDAPAATNEPPAIIEGDAPASTNEPPTEIEGDSPTTTNEPPVIVEGDSPSTTNEPPTDIEGDPAPTNTPPPMMMGRSRPMMSPPPQQTENEPSATYHSSLIPQTSWTKRGAFCDWLRVDFPSSFAFPRGTNLLTGVTLMAWGEVVGRGLRSAPETESTNSIPAARGLAALPMRVSLEPDASSFVHGLTPSNSYLFTWSNVCVNRSPTNRVDASIELFRNGDLAITVTPLSSPSPSTFAYQPTVPPAGFVGSGQDTNWLASVFAPTDYTQITNKGYDAWLDEDYVGVNEQNGHYRADITVASLPDNGVPCYLVCGPYNVVVNQPGTYSFPLEVFEHYRTRTYPIALPLAISTDDGYRGSRFSNSPVLMASRPRLALSAPPSTSPEYDICEQPRLVLSPSRISLSQAAGAVISIWCNISEGASRLYSSLSGLTTVSFTCPSEAEIEESMVADAVEFILETSKGSCSGVVSIEDDHDGNDIPPYHWCCWWCCGNSCSCDGTCCPCDCGCHSGTNGVPPSVTP